MQHALHLAAIPVGLVLIALSLPLLIDLFVLSLAALLPTRRVIAPPAPDFRLAVIIPAHNEEKLISACVQSVLGDPSVTPYVVAHNCSDQTAAAARQAGATVLPLNDDVGGKGAALDYGFRQAISAGAQGLLVLDADSIAAPNLTAVVAARLAAGAGALQARYEVGNATANARTGLAAIALLGMNVLRPRGRDRLGLSCGIFGNGFALSADTLNRVPYTANSLVEDLEYHLHLICAGIPVEFLNDTAVFGEMPEGSAAAPSQRARWEGGRILMRRTWRWPLFRQVLAGRLALFEPLLDLLSLPLANEAIVLVLTLATGIVTQTAWLRDYAYFGACVTILYVVVAASLAADPAASLRALVAAPGYILWKIYMIPKTRAAARRDAAWVRTTRNDT